MANRPKVKKGKSMLLGSVPEDVQRILISKLGDEAENCKCTRGQDYALYKIVREWSGSVGVPDGSMVVCFGGHFVSPSDLDISVVGDRVSVSFKVPITSPVGAMLNYGRQKNEGE